MPAMVLANAMAAPLVLVCPVVSVCPVLHGGDSVCTEAEKV